jgi:curved DNA-binding protein CbpA
LPAGCLSFGPWFADTRIAAAPSISGGLEGDMRVGEQVGKAHAQVLALAPGCDPTRLSLRPAEGYVLSRIDGRTSWATLRQIGALPPQEIDQLVERWLKSGVLVASEIVRSTSEKPADGGQQERAAQAQKPPPATTAPAKAPAKEQPPLPQVDAALELDVELQEEILAFARGVSRRYHEILGVAANADTKAIKRAYFTLSKKLHPDRYFRRKTGAFGPLIESCFKRLLEAYELLSDPQTRGEVQETPATAPADEGQAASARVSSLEARRRLRERVGSLAGHARAHQDRRRKAKTFFEHGMAAFNDKRWLEAAGAVRLAIAFDAENAAYREAFPDVQRRAHEERAKHSSKLAEAALELRDYAGALEHFEEALHFRPADDTLAHRAAKLAFQAGVDLKRAKELAMHAVELAPENGPYRRLLGSVYKAAGLKANAKRELEAALRIDPQDREARDELRSL